MKAKELKQLVIDRRTETPKIVSLDENKPYYFRQGFIITWEPEKAR